MNNENLNAVNDAQQAAVEPVQDTSAPSGTETGTPDNDAKAEVATRRQTKSENRDFAAKRREAEKAVAESTKLIKGMEKIGISGASTDELLEQLEALKANISVEDLRRQKEENLAAVRNNPEFKRLERQLIESGREKDLKAVQEIDNSVQSLEELGDEFFTLRAQGISPKTAYFAIKQSADMSANKPDSIGAVSDGGGIEGEYFTSEQLDRLTAKDLDNPKIYEKAIKSLSRLN